MSQYHPTRIETSQLPQPWHRSYDYAAQPPEELDVDFRSPNFRTTAQSFRGLADRGSGRHGHSTSYRGPDRTRNSSFYGPANHYRDRNRERSPDNYGGLHPRDRARITTVPGQISGNYGRPPPPRVKKKRVGYSRDSDNVYQRQPHYSVRVPHRLGNNNQADEKVIKEHQERESEYSSDEDDLVLLADPGRGYQHRDGGDYDDDDDGPIFYSFDGSLHNENRDLDQGGGGLSDNESTVAGEELQEVPGIDAKEHGAAAYHVLESQYAGDGYEEGHHSVNLTAVLSERAAVTQSLFRWIHFSRPSMDIDDFSIQVATIPGLSSEEKEGLQDMIASVKRDHVKTIQASDGRYVRYLEPKLRHDPLVSDGKPRGSQTVTWICLPYFSLEPYSGLLATTNPKSFPTPTLLQARFARTTRTRDMEQAVCQQKGASQGLCFHIAQLWCLILDNSLLLTYGRITEEALCQGIITKTVKPLQDPQSLAAPDKSLSVRYREGVVWSIPVQECQTWFSFTSHFRNYQPYRLRFLYHAKPVKAYDWPKLYRLALRPDKRLILDLQLRSPLKLPLSDVLFSLGLPRKDETPKEAQPASTTPGVSLSAQSPESPNLTKQDEFSTPNPSSSGRTGDDQIVRLLPPLPKRSHTGGASPSPIPKTKSWRTVKLGFESSCGLFTCLESFVHFWRSPVNTTLPTNAPKPPYSAMDVFKVQYFIDIDNHLRTKTTLGDRDAYDSCTKAYRAGVHAALETERRALHAKKTTLEKRKDFEKRVSLFNAADVVFKFFFRPEADVPTIRKFWGAIQALVIDPSAGNPTDGRDWRFESRAPDRLPSSHKLDQLLRALRDMTADVFAFNGVFTDIEKLDKEHVTAPLTLVNAWMHIVLSLCNYPTDQWRSLALADRARSEMNAVINTMITARSEPLRLRNLVVLPFDLVSLIGMKLLRDVTTGLPDISATYGSYLNSIESDIVTKPSDRRIEHKLGLLQQELSIIDWTVDLQTHVLEKMMATREGMDRNAEARLLEENGTDGHENRHEGHQREHHRAQRWPGRAHAPRYNTMAAMAEGILEPGAPGGFSHSLLSESLKHVSLKRSEVKLMGDVVAHLTATNRNKVNHTKDRQERAIYAFTIVTVVFLPLSAVASIFGMNSADIRDTTLGQWAYWATAVPVTAVVVFLGLWFTGELGNLVEVFAGWGWGWGWGWARTGAGYDAGGKGGGKVVMMGEDGEASGVGEGWVHRARKRRRKGE